MQQSYVIGLDIGTGSVKAVALDNGGTVVYNAQHFYPAASPEPPNEQRIDIVFAAFVQTIREVVDVMRHPPVAIALSCAMHSTLLVDEGGKALTNAILWSDTRATGIAGQLRASALGQTIYKATGTPLHSMSPLCKIRWFEQHEPVLHAKAAKFISIKEAIWFQLFGEYVVDHSLASATGLFDIYQLQWNKEALHFAGITGQQLSNPVPVTYSRKTLQPHIGKLLSLPTDITFIIGGSDGCLANLGSLCLSPTEAAITIGTSAAVRVTSVKAVPNFDRMIFNYLLDSQHFVCGGAINNGGNVFQWLLKNLFANHAEIKTYEQLFQAISLVPAGSDGLLFLPYLHGERAPIWDERSCGVYMGLTAKHSLDHFARAAAEGVCFALQQILSSLEEVCGVVQQIKISGGLVQSGIIMQLLADITGKKVVVQQNDDASALGAAYLAQKTLGIIATYAAIAKREAAIYSPLETAAAHYQKIIPLYQALYPLLKEQMHTFHHFST